MEVSGFLHTFTFRGKWTFFFFFNRKIKSDVCLSFKESVEIDGCTIKPTADGMWFPHELVTQDNNRPTDSPETQDG